MQPFLPHNCCIREYTADGECVGRCMYHSPNDVCPRHGNIAEAMKRYRETGELTDDPREAKRRAERRAI